MTSQESTGNSLAVGEKAFQHIKRFNQSAEPHSYEVWFTYCAGHNPSLNRFVDDIIERTGNISDSDLAELRRRYLNQTDVVDRISNIGEQFSDEVEQVVQMIEVATGVAADFNSTMVETNKNLTVNVDRQTLRNIVEAIVLATREIYEENSKLGTSLKESHEKIVFLQKDLASIRMESLTDALTSVANRRYFDIYLNEAVKQSGESGKPFSLLLIDIDHFKKFNDTHGHQTGDHVLRLMASTMKRVVKGQDSIARYGGEEFAVVLPDTDINDAMTVANNIRRTVATNEIIMRSTGQNLGRITVSIGVATYRTGMNSHALVEAADSCLYAAKLNGRNRAVCEKDL